MTIKPDPLPLPNFSDTRIAFQNKTDRELIRSSILFRIMNRTWLVNLGSKMTRIATQLKLPFVQFALKKTIFQQFCGGINLMDCQKVIDELYRYHTLSILDYGAESKSEEKDLDKVKEELLRAVEFAASNESVPVVSSKLTGLVDNYILSKKQAGEELTQEEKTKYNRFFDRIDMVCKRAEELGVGVFIDAEESWMQESMDEVVFLLMEKYNKNRAIVYNTYQMYRTDKLDQLKNDYEKSREGQYIFGAKLVRGAYMEKERERAVEMGYPSPIHDTKEETDRDFNEGLLFCVERYEELSVCCASHNRESNLLLAKEMIKRKIPRDHKHINFCQLMGMSDYITFNLSMAGFNVSKYVVYGPILEVVDYLIRRAEENTSVTGEMSRELELINKEMSRRGLRA